MGPVAACKGIRISESGKILLVESGILDFVIRKTAQGIRDPTDDWNPESKFHWQRLESGKLSTEVHVPTPRSAVWPVPYTCAQPYPPGSGSYEQLFRPYWGSSAWHSRHVNKRRNPRIKDPLLYWNPAPWIRNPRRGNPNSGLSGKFPYVGWDLHFYMIIWTTKRSVCLSNK